MMTTGETVKIARENSMGNIIYQLDPDSKKITRRLEKIQIQKMKKEYSVLFNSTCLKNNLLPKYTTYIYINDPISCWYELFYAGLSLFL